MIPSPKNQVDEFINILNEMIDSGETNEFQIARIKREAENMKISTPAIGFALLGMVSCVNKDVPNTHVNHKNALHYENSSVQKRFYANSLANLSLFDEAYKYFLEVYKTADKVDLDLLRSLLRCTYKLNMEDDYCKYSDLWEGLTGTSPSVSFFPEDQDSLLGDMFESMDAEIDNGSDMIEEFDPAMLALADDLVKGVSI